MLRPSADEAARLPWRDIVAAAVAALSLAACVAAIMLSSPDEVNSLTPILGVAAFGAGVLVAGESGGLAISASFIVGGLAAAFLGPASAAAFAVIGEVAASVAMRTRWRATLLNNLPPAMVGAVAAAVIIRSLAAPPSDGLSTYAAVALAGAVSLVVSFALFAGLRRLVFP